MNERFAVEAPKSNARSRLSRRGDCHEREADRLADLVVAGRSVASYDIGLVHVPGRQEPTIQRQEAEDDELDNEDESEGVLDESVVQLKEDDAAPGEGDLMTTAITEVVGGAGQPLDSATRDRMESRFGRDFGQVRIHHDGPAAASARSVRAHAYTVRDHLVFAAGKYAPGTLDGDRLLAHELTHTLQQRNSASVGKPRIGPADHEAESEADHVSAAVSAGISAPQVSANPVSDVILRRQTVGQEDARHKAGELIGRYTSFGILDKEGLGSSLVSLAIHQKYDVVEAVFDKVWRISRDNVALAFCRSVADVGLNTIANDAQGRRLLDRVFDELTKGSVSTEEKAEAKRILATKQRRIKPAEFVRQAETGKVFPLALPGFTLSGSPIVAERRPGGEIWVRMNFNHTYGDSRYRQDVANLKLEVFTNKGIVLQEDEIIWIKLYDENQPEVPVPALALIQLSNQTDTRVITKILEAVAIGVTLGVGAAVGAGGETSIAVRGLVRLGIDASKASAALRWIDAAAQALHLLSIVISEQRGSILRTKYGREFLRAADIVHFAVAAYGIARVAVEAPRAVTALRNWYRRWSSQHPPVGTQAVAKSTDEFLKEAEQLVAARAPSSTGREVAAGVSSRTSRSRQVQAGRLEGQKLVTHDRSLDVSTYTPRARQLSSRRRDGQKALAHDRSLDASPLFPRSHQLTYKPDVMAQLAEAGEKAKATLLAGSPAKFPPYSSLGRIARIRTRQGFRRSVERIIRKDPDHPLKKLLIRGRLRTSRRPSERILGVRPEVTDAGHIVSGSLLRRTGQRGADRFFLQSASTNRFKQGRHVEAHPADGYVIGRMDIVDIKGVPVELETAVDLIRKGILDPKALADARLLAF